MTHDSSPRTPDQIVLKALAESMEGPVSRAVYGAVKRDMAWFVSGVMGATAVSEAVVWEAVYAPVRGATRILQTLGGSGPQE